MSVYLVPNVVGSNGEVQYNNNGVLGAAQGVVYDPATLTTSFTVRGVPVQLNRMLVILLEQEAIRQNGTYTIGQPGTVPFGVGPVTTTGMALAPIGPDSYNVIDVASGSFC